MQTLKEISRDAVIKYGVGPRLNIPSELKEELERIETNIQRVMTGRFHRHWGGQSYTDTEIFWERRSDQVTGEEWSQWRFVNHKNGHSATLRCGQVASSPAIWEFFQLEPATDIRIDYRFESIGSTRPKVIFYGHYMPNAGRITSHSNSSEKKQPVFRI